MFKLDIRENLLGDRLIFVTEDEARDMVHLLLIERVMTGLNPLAYVAARIGCEGGPDAEIYFRQQFSVVIPRNFPV